MRALTSLELQQIAGGQQQAPRAHRKPADYFDAFYADIKKELSNHPELKEALPWMVGAFIAGTIFGIAAVVASEDEEEI